VRSNGYYEFRLTATLWASVRVQVIQKAIPDETPYPETDLSRLAGIRRAGEVSPLSAICGDRGLVKSTWPDHLWRGSLPLFLMESSPLEDLNPEKWLDH